MDRSLLSCFVWRRHLPSLLPCTRYLNIEPCVLCFLHLHTAHIISLYSVIRSEHASIYYDCAAPLPAWRRAGPRAAREVPKGHRRAAEAAGTPPDAGGPPEGWQGAASGLPESRWSAAEGPPKAAGGQPGGCQRAGFLPARPPGHDTPGHPPTHPLPNHPPAHPLPSPHPQAPATHPGNRPPTASTAQYTRAPNTHPGTHPLATCEIHEPCTREHRFLRSLLWLLPGGRECLEAGGQATGAGVAGSYHVILV